MQTIVHEPAEFGAMGTMPAKQAMHNTSDSIIGIGIGFELQGDGQGHTSLIMSKGPPTPSGAIKKARLASAKPTVTTQFGAKAGALAAHRQRRLMSARPQNSLVTEVQSRN